MSITKVAVVGVNGKIGEPVLDALVESKYSVTVLQRESSSSEPRHKEVVRVVSVPDAFTFDSLKGAFEGQDAVIICIPLKDLKLHLRLAEAAAAAGVKRYIPADFGSVDAASKQAQDLVPLFKRKTEVQDRLIELVAQHAGFSWTSLVNGHFFDWGLAANFLHFDINKRHADILGSGDQKSSLSTLGRIASAAIKILQRPEETRNQVLFIQSFLVSQNDVLASLERTTGEKWDVTHLDMDQFVQTHKVKADAGDAESIEELVFALGVLDGDWTQRPNYAMELLGLKDEDLDSVVRGVVRATASSK